MIGVKEITGTSMNSIHKTLYLFFFLNLCIIYDSFGKAIECGIKWS